VGRRRAHPRARYAEAFQIPAEELFRLPETPLFSAEP